MMLQKFLFVGVGGSGGVTLRALRALLLDYLAENGYEDGIPAAWQFVHIDVPLEQDRKPERIPLLPRNNYVGLAVDGLPYREVDRMLCANGDSVVRHTAVWRPDPNQVNVAPESGGGRFRAVGRVVLGARMAAAHERLTTAVHAMDGEAANAEFSRVCLQLTGNGEPSALPPQMVVVASLAGGSGSGLLADVCDMLRQLEQSVEDRLVSILYTPQVFDELRPADRAGINPNALAALCELLNGRWNREPPAPDEFAFLRAGGAAAIADVQRRGPRIPYMIGKSNGEVAYASQGDVYEAVARGMTVWVTSHEIQNRFSAYEIGNWADRAINRPDSSGLIGENNELPLSSFGCASVGIGLDRFARYSVDRLTRETVEHVLSGHWRQGDEKKINEEEARRQRVDIASAVFLADCGLDEKGPARNDIIDALRGGASGDEARVAIGGQVRPMLLTEVVERWPARGARTDLVANRVIERMDARWPQDFNTYQDKYVRNAVAWAERLPDVIEKHTADLVADEGARVAVDVLHRVITELTETVVPELAAALEIHRRLVGEMRTRVHAALAGVTTVMPASHPRIGHAVDAALDSFHGRTEELVHELAIDLIGDVCENLLAPLRDALGIGREMLELGRTGTEVKPSQVGDWPTDSDVVPASYQPARNELVLERVADYPKVFTEQICAQADEPYLGNALAKARREVITGITEGDQPVQQMIETRTRWAPRNPRLRRRQTPSVAAFKVHIEVAELRARTRRWIRRPDTPMARHLGQKLKDYLADHGRGGQAQAVKIENFRNLLTQAVALSRPLITIDPSALARVHARQIDYREVMTPMPFPDGHPGREAVARVFAGRSAAEFELLFGPEDAERIDIFTFLDAPVQPVVMSSLTFPIGAQWAQDRVKRSVGGFWTWRRARQLPWFVPCTPEIRKAMVRGWFVARLLNHVRCEDLRGEPTEIWTPDKGYQPFPFPLLGRTIRKRDEWLPAVLESLALTLVGASFAPYARLVALGESVGQFDELAAEGELARWAGSGTTLPGAPQPVASLAGVASGTVADRVAVVIDNLDRYDKHYDEYRRLRLTPTDSLEVSRAWELRDDILEALGVIRKSVEAVTGAGHIRDDEVG
jgi:hypothetical protein